MQIRKLLKLQEVIDEKKLPSDINPHEKSDTPPNNLLYWSRTKGQWINILDMDLIHVIRALNSESKIVLQKYQDENLKIIKDFIEDMEKEVH